MNDIGMGGESARVGATYVQWQPFTFAAAGDYEIHLSVLVNGNKRTDVLRVRVLE